MFPVFNLEGIKEQESMLEENHVIILFLVKPSDKGADDYFKQFNYYHYRSGKYCSIYVLGCSQNFNGKYLDVVSVVGVDNQEWQYSDQCFAEACDELKQRLSNWRYSGEPELIIFQNSSASYPGRYLDFSNYDYIDINYGITKEYIDSFPRFMERLLEACKKEVTADEAVGRSNRKRIRLRKVIEYTLESCPKLPKPVKRILNDRLFFKTYKSKLT